MVSFIFPDIIYNKTLSLLMVKVIVAYELFFLAPVHIKAHTSIIDPSFI